MKKPINRKNEHDRDNKLNKLDYENCKIEFCEHLTIVSERVIRIKSDKTKFKDWETLKNKYKRIWT